MMPQPNSHLSTLPFYEPGRPIEDVARELGLKPETIIKLASNENPIGPSPKAMQAMRKAAAQVNFYPDGNGYLLRKAIAAKHKVEMGQVVLGNGSNEIIEFLGHAYLRPGDEMIISQYAFAVYEIMGRLFEAKIVEIPAKELGHDLEAMLDAISPRTKLIFVANPNNPTGTSVSPESLRRFIERVPPRVIPVLDEAYHEFLDDPLDTPALIAKYPHMVIMRTFSKAQGLAGLRIGYGLASPAVAGNLQKVRQPFNANAMAQAAALASLKDTQHVRKTVRLVKKERKKLEKKFQKRGLTFAPTSANFILVKVGNGKEVFQKLQTQGVIVRPMHGYKLPEWIRVTVGAPAQNKRFLRALDFAIKG